MAYRPWRAGMCALTVRVGGSHVEGSPFNVPVSAGLRHISKHIRMSFCTFFSASCRTLHDMALSTRWTVHTSIHTAKHMCLHTAAVDSSQCVAFGAGLTWTAAGAHASFTVELRDGFGNRSSVGAHDLRIDVRRTAGGDGAVVVQTVERSDGVVECHYTAPAPGQHQVVGQSSP